MIDRDTKTGRLVKGNKLRLSHGMSFSREYHSWASMIQRCTNKKVQYFKNYGARGISVCEKWKTFEGFYSDMGPSNGLTLDRINSDKGYSKENCRWATMKEQQNNRTNNRRFSFNGRNLTLSEWSDEIGVKRSTLSQRILAYKWPIEKALTQPV